MKNKKKLAEMQARKAALEQKLKALKESRSRNGLAFLIESELEKAELVIAAKSIVDKIGKMAEDLAKVEGDDIMPMMDALKTAYGPQMAQNFQKVAGQTLRSTVEALTKSKDALSTEVGKLEGVVNGSAGNDMASEPAPAMAAPETDMGMEAPEGDAGLSADAGGDMGSDTYDFGDEGDDEEVADASLDDLFGDTGAEEPTAAGRARKESFSKRGKLISEGLLDSMKAYVSQHVSKVSSGGSVRERLEAMKPFLTAEDYEIISQFPDPVLTKVFDSTGADVPAVSPSPSVGMGVNMDMSGPDMGDDLVGDMGMGVGMEASAPGDMDMDYFDDEEVDLDGPADLAVDSDFDNLDDRELGSPIKALRSSPNPDSMVYSSFRESIKEGLSPIRAAKKVAEHYSIDFADVVEIVKEAAEDRKVRNQHKADVSDREYQQQRAARKAVKESNKVGAPSNKVKITPQERGTAGMTKELPGGAKFTRPFSNKAAADKHAKDKNLVAENCDDEKVASIPSFKSWASSVDAAMKKKYQMTVADAGLDNDDMKRYYERHKDCSVAEFVKWYGEKYDLSESKKGKKRPF